MKNIINFQKKTMGRLCTAMYILLSLGVIHPATAQTEQNSKGRKTAKAELLKRVEGKIVDVADQPVIGATIQIKGTQQYTVSDLDGVFRFPRVKDGSVLVIQFVGMKTQEVVVDSESLLVRMQEDAAMLDEVVAIGYQTKIKANLTSSVTQVNMDDLIKNQPTTDPVSLLQGVTPGAHVSSATSQPGQNSAIQVRGMSSVNEVGPYIVIDGVPGGNIYSLNPNDIESITVIKDAAGAAIYGANAGSGVILVTTKKGGYNKQMSINYSGNYVYKVPSRIPEYTNSYDNAVLANTAYENAGMAPKYTEEQLGYFLDPSVTAIANGNVWNFYADTDWLDMMFDNAAETSHTIDISGGSESVSYRASGSFMDKEGFFAKWGPDGQQRYNLSANFQAKLLKKKAGKSYDRLLLNVKTDYNRSTLKRPGRYPSSDVYSMGPDLPVYDPNGNYARYANNSYNPVQSMEESGTATTIEDRFDMLVGLTYNANKYLSFEARGSYSLIYSRYTLFNKAFGYYGPNGLISEAAVGNKPNSIDEYMNYQGTKTWRFMGTYARQFNKHDINFIFGNEGTYTDRRQVRVYRDNIAGNEIPSFLLGSTENWTNSGAMYDESSASFFGRFSYNYDNRYLLEAILRADASSRFSSKNKWGYFPGISGAWRIINEDFMKEQNIFSDLKFRASWGQVGNKAGIGRTDYIVSYKIDGYYPFAGENGEWIVPSNMPMVDRTWETVTVTNLAVDVAFFDNRLYFIGEVYKKKNTDMIVPIDVPNIIGGTISEGNNGSMQTLGWELSGGWKHNLKSGFKYNASFTLSRSKNEILDYGTEATEPALGRNLYLEGYPYWSYFGYECGGFYESQEEIDNSKEYVKYNNNVKPGDLKYKDQNGDGKLNTEDLVYLGQTNSPEYSFGISLGAAYKGFDFSATFQGELGASAYLERNMVQCYYSTNDVTSFELHKDYWREDNKDAIFPRPVVNGVQNYVYSSFWMNNASYIRLKNISLGYTFPKKWISKIGAKNLRVFVNGQNLFELTDMLEIFDPENPGKNYPLTRSFAFGINVGF